MPKPADAPPDLGFVRTFAGRIEALDLAKLDQEQRDSFAAELEKIRSSACQILKALRG